MAELKEVWDSGWLSNSGLKNRQLEKALTLTLRSEHISLFNNGTTALIAACKALDLSGEVITTPFTFPATPNALKWNGISPIFADIDPENLTIDPNAVEALITTRTSGILAVHVYGMPCNISALESIAKKYNLGIIYDAAHAFGTEIDGVPITQFGDATMLSFHATKLFHTAEGGAIVSKNLSIKNKIDLIKNFGIQSESVISCDGLNGKMNELQAALGIVNLRYIESERTKRQIIGSLYRERFAGIDGLNCFSIPQNVRHSEQYFVVRISSKNNSCVRDRVFNSLKDYNIYTRRYFYPLCCDALHYNSDSKAKALALDNAYQAADEVLALPYYGGLDLKIAEQICDIVTYEMSNVP